MRALMRRLRREDSGLSLTELLVSSILTLLILVMVGSFFISVTKITTTSNQIRQSNDAATNIVNEVTAVVRVSTDLVTNNLPDVAVGTGSTRSKLTVYSLSNTTATAPAPSKITFELIGTDVKETRCPATANGSEWVFTAPCTTRTLGSGVVGPTGTTDQLFTYRDSNGNPIVITSGTPSGSGSLSDTQRDAVAAITIQVQALAPSTTKTNAAATFVSNTVVLRNLGLDTAS